LITRLYLRDLLLFERVELDFKQGLVVLTGPSGAGKSVLISAILTTLGYSSPSAASLCEINLTKPNTLTHEAYELSSDLTIKSIKKEKLRYFIEGQSISKKSLRSLFSPFVKYLSVRDRGGFESQELLAMIDQALLLHSKPFKRQYKAYTKRYTHYKMRITELEEIKAKEAKLTELIEFTTYEIEKIEAINPQIGEEEELLRIKQQLSRIDKIKEALEHASSIFSLEASVEEVYRLLDRDGSLFGDAMNQLRADFEETANLAEELEEVDIEAVLDRLSQLTTLINRYGSIQEALAYKEQKEQALAGYKSIEQDKGVLEQFLTLEGTELTTLASKLSTLRKQEAIVLQKRLLPYLQSLKLPALSFTFEKTTLGSSGYDHLTVTLGTSQVSTLSGGEFNRVRLALMATTINTSTPQSRGVLILDEIDANVSGDESIAIATMIEQLSSAYQIFAISHQPHLSARANQHILITKADQKSLAKVLTETERITEIARIIGGENPTSQAIEFAKKLRG